jgi:hypothetical protein
MTAEIQEISYFQQRMNDIGCTEQNNIIEILESKPKEPGNHLVKYPIFKETEQGISILVYSIERTKILYAKNGSRYKLNDYAITRLQTPKVKPNGDVQKYDIPKGVPTQPFFPPSLCNKYLYKQKIKVLYITEGYFKAFSAALAGIDCVGVPSITCLKNKETNKLHDDILKLIQVCKVERLVWLVDGDCLNISTKQFITEPKDNTWSDDLAKRPKQFYSTISSFYELTSELEIKKYFAHIKSDDIEGNPKGLDDLIKACSEHTADIVAEALQFDKVSMKKYEGNYFTKFDITQGLGQLWKYFCLNDVNTFYLYHLEKNPSLKGRYFVFNGTTYLYNDKEGKCEVKVPKNASDYFRVGDKYYKHILVPNRYGEKLKSFQRRERSTIIEDHGKELIQHIPKYESFCVVPNHIEYERIVDNCFNLYAPFEHEIEQGECDTILNFIKHIFSETEVKYYDKELKQEFIYTTYDLALDYLAILFKKPQQILPILCLVSEERQTGKTTFAKLLNLIYTDNMAIVGNDDLEAQFNAHWSSKLIICCDETKIDKVKVVEKVKSLSTSSSIMMNSKGKDQVSMEFFGKFIFLSNNEDNFINIDSQEIRFWIHKVKPIETKNVRLLENMIEEIPAFINFLNTRKILTLEKERHWFKSELLVTDALRKVVENSKPSIEKTIISHIQTMFETYSDVDEFTLPFIYIQKEILKGRYQDYYTREIIRKKMQLELLPPQKRHYPRMVEKNVNGEITETAETIHFHGRYYLFKREDYSTIKSTKPISLFLEENNTNNEIKDNAPW